MSPPAEEAMGFPMSRVSSRASSSRCLRMSSAKRVSTFLRFCGWQALQPPFSKAARAAATARFTSSASHSAIWVSTRPSIGETQSKVLPEAAGTCRPLMKAWLR